MSPVIVVEPFSLFRCVDTLLTSVKVACDVTWNTTNSILTKKTQLNPNYQYSAVFIFIITKETVQISIIIINTTIMDRISLLLHRLRASCKKQDKHHHDCRTWTQIQRRKKPNVFQKEFSIKQTYTSQNWKDKINDARIKIITLKTFVTCVMLGFLLSMLACDNNEGDFPLAGLSFLVLHKIRIKIKMRLSSPSSLAQITCWGDDSSSSSPSSAHIQLAEWRIPGGYLFYGILWLSFPQSAPISM